MNDLIQQLKTKFREGDVSVKLIFINIAVFIITAIVDFIFFRGSVLGIDQYFGARPSIEGFFNRPWGILTYSFFHGSPLHLVLNMIMVYFVGKLFLRYFRNEDLLTFYLWGALGGALFFMIFSGILNYGQILIGASAAVYAIFFALVAYIPKTKVQLMFINLNIPLDYVGYFLIGYDLLMILSGQFDWLNISDHNIGGHISHLGGAAFGFLYMKQFEKGNDFLGGFIYKLFYKNPKSHNIKTKKPPKDDYEFNSQKIEKQQKVDRILDKISRSGYESLSKEEKDLLFKSGKND